MKLVNLSYIFLLFLFSCSHNHHHHRFSDAKKWAKKFEDSNRDLWQRPNIVINHLKIKEDSIIADIGSATGYFPIRLAKVATKGRVWAIDIEPNLINYLNERAENEKLNNLFSILGTMSDPLIPEKVDFILMVNTYHHISKRITYFKNLKSKLKKNGKIVIIDFKKKDLPVGPSLDKKLSSKQIIHELSKAGFSLLMMPELLKYQNVMIFSL